MYGFSGDILYDVIKDLFREKYVCEEENVPQKSWIHWGTLLS